MALSELPRQIITLDMIVSRISELIDQSGTNMRLGEMLADEVAGVQPSVDSNDAASPRNGKLDDIMQRLNYLSDNLGRERNALRRLENVLSSEVTATNAVGRG